MGGFGFAIVFGSNKKHWLLIAVDAMLSWMVYLGCCTFTSSFFANLLAAAFCSLYAHIAARAVKAPTTCLLTPATVPFIPGGSLYYTVYYALSRNGELFRKYAIATGETVFAVAIGFSLIYICFWTYERQ